MHTQNRENLVCAIWLILLFCCDSLPGNNKHCLGKIDTTKLVLATQSVVSAFESMAFQATILPSALSII